MIYSKKLNIVIVNYCSCENKWFKYKMPNYRPEGGVGAQVVLGRWRGVTGEGPPDPLPPQTLGVEAVVLHPDHTQQPISYDISLLILSVSKIAKINIGKKYS